MHIAKKKDFYSALTILLLVGICFVESRRIDPGINFALGPLFFPHILLSLITVFSCLLLAGSIKGGAALAAERQPLDVKTVVSRVVILGLTALYLLALPLLGYIPCTVAFLLICMIFLGRRTPRDLALYAGVAAAITLGLQYIFGSLLHLFLP